MYETCPWCGVDLRDHDRQPDGDKSPTRTIGVFIPSVERVLVWKCPDCRGMWNAHRPEDGPVYDQAAGYLASHRAAGRATVGGA
jgi:Zn-finger nucleic acid-binding protein